MSSSVSGTFVRNVTGCLTPVGQKSPVADHWPPRDDVDAGESKPRSHSRQPAQVARSKERIPAGTGGQVPKLRAAGRRGLVRDPGRRSAGGRGKQTFTLVVGPAGRVRIRDRRLYREARRQGSTTHALSHGAGGVVESAQALQRPKARLWPTVRMWPAVRMWPTAFREFVVLQ